LFNNLGVAILVGFRSLEWAWQNVFWQIDRNLKLIKIKGNTQQFFKMWAWQVWVILGR